MCSKYKNQSSIMLSNVNTSLSGFVRANNGLRFIQDRNCIVRRQTELTKKKVKLISGGGSGHEPAHAGYVGHGMLDGAVCGDVFCSPSATSIVDCLRTIAEPNESVLFVVNNYTGDRLNFGLAMERARTQHGYNNLKLLLNDDDCSIEESLTRKSVGKRGLAGKILLIKILGAMAELGETVDELARFGDELLRQDYITTFGFTFDVANDKLFNIELGKGLHGEPGVHKMDTCDSFEPVIHFMMNKISKKVKVSTEVVVLINNLGGTSELVVGVFVKMLSDILGRSYTIRRIYSGTFFSSLNQTGLSVTLLNLGYSDQLLNYLDYEVQVASPLFGRSTFHLPLSETLDFQEKSEDKCPKTSFTYKLKFCDSNKIHNIITKIAQTLLLSRDLLNTYDKECGDGDTGNTISNGAESLLVNLTATINLQHPARMLQDISKILQVSVGGTSGATYSLFFQAASKAFVDANNDPKLTIVHWHDALAYGNEAIMRYALTELGDRTMLDPLKQAELQLKQSILQQLPTTKCIEVFARTCEDVAASTRYMTPKSGRAAYSATGVNKVNYRYPDPGAHAVAIWALALLNACNEGLQ